LLQDVVSVFFFGEISHAGEKKKPWLIQQRAFWDLRKKQSPYLEKKTLKVAIFRQCAPVGRQN
jgi:hypothetical protein